MLRSFKNSHINNISTHYRITSKIKWESTRLISAFALPTIRVKRRGRHATLRRSAAHGAALTGSAGQLYKDQLPLSFDNRNVTPLMR